MSAVQGGYVRQLLKLLVTDESRWSQMDSRQPSAAEDEIDDGDDSDESDESDEIDGITESETKRDETYR